ncbi:hypothetical protein ACFE04_006784 [Oxalis oulophora]
MESLCDDGFEGSQDEHCIFSEVFFKNSDSPTSKRCLVTGVINFECEDCTNTDDASLCFNSENSPVMCASSINQKVKDCGSSLDNNLLGDQHDENLWSYRGKNPVDEPTSSNPELENTLNIIKFRLIESSSQGFICSSYLSKKRVETDRQKNTDDPDIKKCNLSISDEKEGLFGKTASPVSQESFAPLLVGPSPSTAVLEKFGSCQEQTYNGLNFPRLDDSDISLLMDPKKDPRILLQKYIFYLLRIAGWDIEKRQRPSRKYMDTIYKSPEGRIFRDFPTVWKTFGEKLLEKKQILGLDADCSQWGDISQFFSDMLNTLKKLEEGCNQSNLDDALLHHWRILDPFVSVVFIYRKVGSLRKGDPVKAAPSLMIKKKRKTKNDALTDLENVNSPGDQCFQIRTSSQLLDFSLASESTLTVVAEHNHHAYDVQSDEANGSPVLFVGVPKRKRGSEYIPSLLASGSSSSGIQSGSFPYISPVPSENFGSMDRSESDVALPICDLQISENFVANSSKTLESMDSSKIRKSKPKKKSEIKLITFYRSNNLVSTSDDRTKWQDADKCDNELASTEDQEAPHQTKKEISKSKKIICSGSRRGKKKCQIKDDDLLVAAIIKNKNCSPKANGSASKVKTRKSRKVMNIKNRKGSCRLLPQGYKGGKYIPTCKFSIIGERTVLSFLILNGVISLNDVIQYRNLENDTVIKDGTVSRNGIVCSCCGETFSVSKFKSHAGNNLNGPCLHLFMESGKPFTLCQLQAWSDEYKVRKSRNQIVDDEDNDQNDDSCGLCGNGGELICCDNCPSTFHLACLSMKELPDGNWYCFNCTCSMCGKLVNDKDTTQSTGFKCAQCEHTYHESCLGDGIVRSSDKWCCGESCQQVHVGLNSQVGIVNTMTDGYSWVLLRCIKEDQKVHSAQKLALKAYCNSNLAVALTIMEECFQAMIDARTGIDMIPQVLYNWGSEFARLNYHGFFTMVLEKDDVLITVASIRVHGVAVAEMPLIATCSNYRRQGMCRRLMSALEKMLLSMKVETLVISAIPGLVDTWTDGFGFTPVEDYENRSLKKMNLMVFPGTVLLKKRLRGSEKSAGKSGEPFDEPVQLPEGNAYSTSICTGPETEMSEEIVGNDTEVIRAPNKPDEGEFMRKSAEPGSEHEPSNNSYKALELLQASDSIGERSWCRDPGQCGLAKIMSDYVGK